MKNNTNTYQPEFTTENYEHDEMGDFDQRVAQLKLTPRLFQASGREESFTIEFVNGKAYQALHFFAAICA